MMDSVAVIAVSWEGRSPHEIKISNNPLKNNGVFIKLKLKLFETVVPILKYITISYKTPIYPFRCQKTL